MLIFQFRKSKKFLIWNIPKILNLEYSKNSYNWLIREMIELLKLFNFQIFNFENLYFEIRKIIKYFMCSNNFEKMKEWILHLDVPNFDPHLSFQDFALLAILSILIFVLWYKFISYFYLLNFSFFILITLVILAFLHLSIP